MYYSCDADPAALAKYVVALVKKDKPVEELKEICIDQLEVFLSDGEFGASQSNGVGVRDPGNSRGEGGWTIKITFQGDNFELSTKIATY